MITSKKIVSIVVSFVLVLALWAVPAPDVSAAAKDGCYMFAMNTTAVEAFYTADDTFRVKKGSKPFVSYGKKKFKWDEMQPIDKNYDFEIADKVYTWETEDPVHTVKKFGVELSVTRGKTLSKKKFVEQFSTGFIVLYLIVKDGEIVAAGASA